MLVWKHIIKCAAFLSIEVRSSAMKWTIGSKLEKSEFRGRGIRNASPPSWIVRLSLIFEQLGELAHFKPQTGAIENNFIFKSSKRFQFSIHNAIKTET
jgi:hypothetical protein